jgi:hypothetical protein
MTTSARRSAFGMIRTGRQSELSRKRENRMRSLVASEASLVGYRSVSHLRSCRRAALVLNESFSLSVEFGRASAAATASRNVVRTPASENTQSVSSAP